MSEIKNHGSIFNTIGIERTVSKWEEYLYVLTPVVFLDSMWFKREDMFAPLGYGSINGSKLRQAIYLISEQFKEKKQLNGIVTGASIRSPQLPITSAVARHFGYESLHVIGATTPNTAINSDMVEMAAWFGASFQFLKIGYNPVLQNKVNEIVQQEKEKYFKINYGISLNPKSNVGNIFDFYNMGAFQVQNIPEQIENLIIPAGSCNTLISILYGITKHRPKSLKNIYIIQIGPDKIQFVNKTLNKLTDEPLQLFSKYRINNRKLNGYDIQIIDIHKIPKYDYQRSVEFYYGGIEFHPTYEGKVMDYVYLNLKELICPETLLWIVGSKARIENTEGCSILGGIPKKLNVVESKNIQKGFFK